jgi:hypothetical protein
MWEKNKNKRNLFPEFLRYRRGEMTGEERNSFEREHQKDPFAEEAADGFSQISADQAKEDISILQKRLAEKIKRRSGNAIYRYAAVIAVLMIVSAIFLITHRKNQVITLSENISREIKPPVSAPVPEALPSKAIKAPARKKVVPPPVSKKSQADDQVIKHKVAELQVPELQQQVLKDSEITEPDLSLITADKEAVKTYASDKKMDMARALGAPANAKSEITRNYMPPQPVVGRDSFDIYLEKNIRNPEPEKSRQIVVVISFKVKIDSTITGIKIISSPGQAYSGEAIRLIKKGPAWKPAEENSVFIEDEVRVSIIFK